MTSFVALVARARQRVEASFPDSATIWRESDDVDAERNPVRTRTEIAAVDCWLQEQPTQTSDVRSTVVAGEIGQDFDAVVLVAYGTDVRAGDVLEIGSSWWRVAEATDRRFHVRCNVTRGEP